MSIGNDGSIDGEVDRTSKSNDQREVRSSNQNVGHGHVFPRPDGMKARCGGPAMCSECAKDTARKYASEVEASVPLSTYESAVKGRQDFRKAYVEARQLLKKFIDAWEGVPGHENMDRLCEIARNGPMPQDETSATPMFYANRVDIENMRDGTFHANFAQMSKQGPGDTYSVPLYAGPEAEKMGRAGEFIAQAIREKLARSAAEPTPKRADSDTQVCRACIGDGEFHTCVSLKDAVFVAPEKAEEPTARTAIEGDLVPEHWWRVHRELANGHISVAMAVVAAVIDGRPLPECAACDVTKLAINDEKSSEQLLADRDRLREVNQIAIDKAQAELESREKTRD